MDRNLIFYAPFTPKAALELQGEDAFTYLQSQFSGNLALLKTVGSGLYGFFLNPKGKILTDAFIIYTAQNRYILYSYFCEQKHFSDIITRNVVADAVEVESIQLQGVAILGMAPFLESLKGSGSETVFTVPALRTAEKAFDCLFRPQYFEGFLQHFRKTAALSGFALELANLEAERIQAGVPAVSIDLTEENFPQEGGLERFVSLEKGCYVGQEVMNRLSRGHVNQKLCRVKVENISTACSLELPYKLQKQEKSIGTLTSLWKEFGIAIIKTRVLEGDAETMLNLKEAGGPTLSILPANF